MKRRELLLLGGAAFGAWAVRPQETMAGAKDWTPANGGLEWNYASIDPLAAGQKAYELYGDGSCMYAVFRAIVEAVGEERIKTHPAEAGQWASIPFFMFRYGKGGVYDYGSLCGALNGCAAAISLFVPVWDDAAKLTTELYQFYEATVLPVFVPAKPKFTDVPQTVSDSVLCHVSSGKWCAEAGEEAESPRRKERCKRLVADCVVKTISLLDRYFASKKAGEACPAAPLTEPSASCVACHSPKESQPGVNVKMKCDLCHEGYAPDHSVK